MMSYLPMIIEAPDGCTSQVCQRGVRVEGCGRTPGRLPAGVVTCPTWRLGPGWPINWLTGPLTTPHLLADPILLSTEGEREGREKEKKMARLSLSAWLFSRSASADPRYTCLTDDRLFSTKEVKCLPQENWWNYCQQKDEWADNFTNFTESVDEVGRWGPSVNCGNKGGTKSLGDMSEHWLSNRESLWFNTRVAHLILPSRPSCRKCLPDSVDRRRKMWEKEKAGMAFIGRQPRKKVKSLTSHSPTI